MSRILALPIALLAYGAFFASFLYLVGFVGGFDFMPTHVNKGVDSPAGMAVVVDIVLIALFGLQHSVMARQGFKQGWTRVVPPLLERSFYLMATVLVLVVLYLNWRPIEGTIWSVENETARMAIWAVFWLGWGILFISTWLLNHFELFGLQQAWHLMRGSTPPPHQMRTPLFYKLVRHPIYTGFFLAFWATPDMTYGHLLFSVGFTLYILVGIAYEEKDLVAFFGEEYVVYRRKVGAIIPGIGKGG